MDEKNAYTELQKQTRAKAKARREASKQIKALAEKKEKVISKYEQAAEDKTCMTFHQYCRKKWASEVGIESVPDDDETDAVWQEKLNAEQREEDVWDDVPDVGNGLKSVNERLVARLSVILGTKFVNHDLRLGAKTSITAQNATFFDLLLLFKEKEGVQLFKNFMVRTLNEAASIDVEDYWWKDCSIETSIIKASDEVLKEIIVRGIRSLEMNRKLGLEKEKLELIIKRHFPKEDTRYCLIKTSAGSMTKFTIVRKRQRRRLLIQHQNRPRVLKHILRSREMNKQVLRQLIRPLKIKKRHQVEKDAQRLVAGVWLYLLCFSS